MHKAPKKPKVNATTKQWVAYDDKMTKYLSDIKKKATLIKKYT